MVTILVAATWFGFNAIIAVLVAVLVSVLVYQRVANKRSWRSIVWGVYAEDE